jgi:hypothetical protein
MKKPTGEDIWYGYNQPYGYWRVGNPLVKVSVLTIVIAGTFMEEPSLTFQGLAALFIMLFAPVNPDSRYQNFIMNFGLGSFIITSLYFVPYDSLRFTRIIPNIATIDWLSIMTALIIFLAFLKVVSVATTRDFAWLVDLMPKHLREQVGGLVYSFGYSIPRAPGILWEADEAIRSRGGYRPFALSTLWSLDRFVDTIGIWILYIMRQIEEMALTVDYTIESRIMLGKRGKTPIVRKLSQTDYAMVGMLVIGIIGSRIMLLVTHYRIF